MTYPRDPRSRAYANRSLWTRAYRVAFHRPSQDGTGRRPLPTNALILIAVNLSGR